MITICDSSIVENLRIIYEELLKEEVYPSIWKRTNIIPVQRKNSRQSKNKYHPISLQPIFGKVLEKLIYDSVYRYRWNNDILTPHHCLHFILVIQQLTHCWLLHIKSTQRLRQHLQKKFEQYFLIDQRHLIIVWN